MDCFDTAPRPLVITVIGFENLSKALPLLAGYFKVFLRDVAESPAEGAEIRFV
jgi:hypothetical protein